MRVPNRIRAVVTAFAAVALVLAVLPSQLAAASGPRAPATADRNVPVLFVHGLNPFEGAGYPCPWYWGVMETALRQWGYRGRLVDLKYQALDTLCMDTIDGDGSHDAHFGHDDPTQSDYNHAYENPNSHSSITPIEHLGYHLAWYVYDHYSSLGRTVDLVGHSMGGLIVRYALTEEAAHDPDFPPYLYVRKAVTLETPHGGADLAKYCNEDIQCVEMLPGSAFLSHLSQDPQATGGTEWTVMGSEHDELVPPQSAVDMAVPHRIIYRRPTYDHFTCLGDPRTAHDAVWRRSDDGGPWIRSASAPHYVREVFATLIAP